MPQFCEDCRIKASWPRPATYPYHNSVSGRCEVCRVDKDSLYDMQPSELVPEKDKSDVQKTIDKTIQNEYARKAEDLTITIVYGPFAGREDRQRTEQLRKVFVKRNEEVDWRATYEIRLKIQQAHYKFEERKRDQNR